MTLSELPSAYYFRTIQTDLDYVRLYNTGMLYEIEPNAPSSWQEHCEMLEAYQKLTNAWSAYD